MGARAACVMRGRGRDGADGGGRDGRAVGTASGGAQFVSDPSLRPAGCAMERCVEGQGRGRARE